MNKPEYIGRYTVSEYALAKQQMIRNHPDLRAHQVEDICRYIAKFNWSEERRDSYLVAKNDGDFSAGLLKNYDEAQEIFDRIHHGENFLRFYPKIENIPESDREFPHSLVVEALLRKTYTGPVPDEYKNYVKEENDARTVGPV